MIRTFLVTILLDLANIIKIKEERIILTFMSFPTKSTCFYCEKINKYENKYPVREGRFTTDNTVLRCPLHSQFQCSICNKFHHFSWLYWCPKELKLVCGDCNPPILKPLKFWSTTYVYSYNCSHCREHHYDLYYAEYQGTHPWQNRLKKHTIGIIEEISETNYWIPNQIQEGNTIPLDKALIIPNSAFPIRKQIGSVKFHSPLLIDHEKVKQIEVREKWEKTSKNWIGLVDKVTQDDQGDLNRQFIIDPAMWEQIGEVKGLKILDAGCGNGYFSRALAKKGANVIGVDQSQVLIQFCKEKEKIQNLGIEFFAESLDNLSMLNDESFDLIVSNIVFIDVLPYEKAFKELARVLKPLGRFIWSNLHPAFGRITNTFYRVPYDTPRNEERLYMLIDRYFDSGSTLISWGSMEPIWQFDRTLTEYSTALKNAGFVIRQIIEPRPDNEDIKQNPRYLAFDTDRIPYFIIYECIKYADR